MSRNARACGTRAVGCRSRTCRRRCRAQKLIDGICGTSVTGNCVWKIGCSRSRSTHRILRRPAAPAASRFAAVPRALAPEVVGPEKSALEQVLAQVRHLLLVEDQAARLGHHDERAPEERRSVSWQHEVTGFAARRRCSRGSRQLRQAKREVDVGARVVHAPAAPRRRPVWNATRQNLKPPSKLSAMAMATSGPAEPAIPAPLSRDRDRRNAVATRRAMEQAAELAHGTSLPLTAEMPSSPL